MPLFLRQTLVWILLLGAAGCSSSVLGQNVSAQAFDSLPREYFVRGTVVSVHPHKAAITIRGNNVAGYLRFRQRSYRVRQPEVLNNFRPGDQVKAVYSMRDRMIYHLVHTISAPAPSKRLL